MEGSKEDLTLFYNELSEPSRAVKTILLLGKIDHKEELVNILTGEQNSERVTAINPRGKVPFIKHGDFALSESNAILKYLCDSFDSIPEHWYPKDI